MGAIKDIFGPSQKEVWTKLSDEIEAKFVSGGFWKTNKVLANVNEWTITLDTFAVHAGKVTVVYTRMRAPFVSKDGFRFKITHKHFFSGLAKFFGQKTIETGFQELDKRVLMKSNDEYKLKKLFINPHVRALVESQPKIHFEIKDEEPWPAKKFPSDVDELYFQVGGVVKDTARLKVMFQLFAETLNQLVEMGSAYDKDPGVVLK